MSQTWDVDLISPTGTSPSADIQRIIDGFNALRSVFSGASEPAVADRVAYMFWADTTTGLLKQRNAANSAWVAMGTMASIGLGNLANSSMAKTANYTVVAADRGKFISCTNAITIFFMAVATLGDGFTSIIRNDGFASVILDPNASELIDGQTTITLTAGETVVVYCDGTALKTLNQRGQLFTTGDIKMTLKTAADVGWVLMNDTSIGSASSGATGRANADTELLYSLIWTNVTDTWAAVVGGRGASAAADFAANKALFLPKTLGRALAGYGTGTTVATGVDGDVDLTGDTFLVPSNNSKWITGQQVVFTLTSGTITGLTSGNTYYVIRNSATLIQLASTLANALTDTQINLTAKSTPVWTITHTYTARALGEHGGEDMHANTIAEMPAHVHTETGQAAPGAGGAAGSGVQISFPIVNTSSTGGSTAHNNIQPSLFLNVMVKL